MFNSTSDGSIPNQIRELGSCVNPVNQNCVSPDKPLVEGKKRNRPGNPDPEAEVVALSPDSLTATHRFFCEICNKGFTRDQNLQLHRRGHNLPWKLKQGPIGNEMKRKKRYVCPEPTCIHHSPSRALGDLTGIKKHFLRKHFDGEKKWKCEKCTKLYAVESDFKAHSKTCGTKEYPCDSGTIFSRTGDFLTHGIHCDSLAKEHTERFAPQNPTNSTQPNLHFNPPQPPSPPSIYHGPQIHMTNSTQPNLHFNHLPPPSSPPPSIFPFPYPSSHCHFNDTYDPLAQNPNTKPQIPMTEYVEAHIDNPMMWSLFRNSQSAPATTLPPLTSTEILQKGVMVGTMGQASSTMSYIDMHATTAWLKSTDPFTRDFIGMADQCGSRNVARGEASGSAEVLPYFGEANYNMPDRGRSFPSHQVFEDQSNPDTWRNYW